MTKISKLFVVIASSLLVSFASVAGELSVTGSAKASYLVNGGGGNNDNKGLGVSNELKFSASGELDNGYTWNYHMELDPNGGGTTDADDSSLTINTNGMGTIGIFDSEGGLSTELAYGVGALGTGVDYANSMGAAGTNGALNWGYDVSSYLTFSTTYQQTCYHSVWVQKSVMYQIQQMVTQTTLKTAVEQIHRC